MSSAELLRALIAALDQAGIPHMLTGSLAAAWYGAGRATLDIDLVVEMQADRIGALIEAISGPDMYVSPDAARDALNTESMFNVIDTGTGWKAHLIIRKSRPFSRTEFGRRRPVEFEGVRLWVATPEDLIIAKLEWAKLGASARQIEDVRALMRINGPMLDRKYLERWIAELGLVDEWRTAGPESGPIPG